MAKKRNWVDLIFVGVFALFAFIYFWGRWNGLTPFTQLWTDGGVVASYAAALDHPGYFLGDPLLGSTQDLHYYMAAHIPIIRMLSGIVGDYGTAYIILLGPMIFIQLVGFYILGRRIFGSRFWAFLLSALSLVTIFWGASDYWGLFPDPQPRFLFQAFFPYLMILSFSWQTKPYRWPLLMIAAGLMLYLHPVSGPVVGFMVWVGLFTYKPVEWKWPKYFAYLFVLGLVFVIITAPFWSTYLFNHHGKPVPDYADALAFYHSSFDAIMNTPRVFSVYLQGLWQYGLLIPSLIGLVIAQRFSRIREAFVLIIVWLAACLFISALVPWVEHVIEARMEILPIQIDLVRGLRYTIPLLLIISLWPFVLLSQYLAMQPNKFVSLVSPIFSLLLSLGFAINAAYLMPQRGYVFLFYPQIAFECWAKRQIVCPSAYQKNTVDVLAFIRENTPKESRFLSIPEARLQEEVRYIALHPIQLSSNDSARVFYSDIDLALQLAAKEREWARIASQTSSKDQIDGFVALACDVGADYLLADKDLPVKRFQSFRNLEIVYANNSFTVLKILSCDY
jgi:hypothetical protein